MLQTTETLIAGLAANDETRWARFYRDYAPYIERTLLKHTPLSPSDVEDVIHETLVALVAFMPAYRHVRAGTARPCRRGRASSSPTTPTIPRDSSRPGRLTLDVGRS